MKRLFLTLTEELNSVICSSEKRTTMINRTVKMMIATVFAVCMVLTAAVVFAPQVMAATIQVDSNLDTTGMAICTLRSAITAANSDLSSGGCDAGSGDDTITFDANLSGQTIILTSDLPTLSSNITIDGSGLASHIQISGNNARRVFYVISGTTVTLNHIDIINGKSSNGGGVFNFGTLTVSNSVLSGNSATVVTPTSYGGGIDNRGTLTVANSVFSGNSAHGYGGAIFNAVGNTLTVSNSTFSGNSAGTSGGGGISSTGTLTVSNSAFSSNSAYTHGGGIYYGSGILTVSNSAFSGNSANTHGGGIYNASSSTWTVSNSTFSGNSAGTNGGGICNNGGALNVSNATFSGNLAGSNGGGNLYISGICTLTLRNSILADSIVGGDCVLGGAVSSALNNLIKNTGANACGLTNGTNGNIIGADPLLSALADNGGPTKTMALQAGSPAIDAGDAANCTTTDQRGYSRVGNCDIGAFEYTPPTPGYGSSPVSGSTIDVGTAAVGSSVSSNLAVSETGTATLNVISHVLSGADAADFSVTPATLSIADGGTAQNLTIQCIPSASGTRTAILTVSHNAPGSPATYTLNCTGTPPPAISLSATTGNAGDSIIISTSNFISLTSPAVTFGTNTATVTNISPPNLTVTVPAGFSAVTVTVTSGGQSATAPFSYSALPTYTVQFISDSAIGGTISPSSPQTVDSGSQTTSVTATPNTGYTFLYWKQGSNFITINATLPPQTVTADTTYTAYFAVQPTISTVSPNSGPTLGGTTVTITGTNFIDGATVVKFGTGTSGVAATLISVTPNQIICTSPSHSVAEAVPIVVFVNGVAAYSVPTSGGFSYYYTVTANFIVNPAGGGTVNLSSQTVASGAQSSEVMAVPMAGYTFIDWRDQNGNFITTSPTLPAQTITADMTYTAYFSSASGNIYTWIGMDTGNLTGWLIAGNWTPSWITRTSADNAVIPPSIANMPVLASLATLNSLKIDGSLYINSSGTLKANAVFLNGT